MKPKKVLLVFKLIMQQDSSKDSLIEYAPDLVVKFHLDLLQRIYGKENVLTYDLGINYLYSLILFGFKWFYLPSLVRNFFKTIEEEKIEEVFIEGASNGWLIRLCKKRMPSLKIISFPHNCESDVMEKKLPKVKKNWVHYLLSWLQGKWVKYAIERWNAVYSDIVITLTERDKRLLLENYPRLDEEKIKILPLSLPEDNFVFPREEDSDYSPGKNIESLFVASDWSPNVEGLQYYIEEVMPALPRVTLHVAGKICFMKSKFPRHDRVIYHGYVPNLTSLYQRAHFMAIPVFWGGGMKVKTVQALQYGKIIFAPTEVFVGYRITPEIGEVCDDASTFVEKINHWIHHKKLRKFNPPSRKMYESEYHPSVLEQKLRLYLEE